MLLGGNDVAGIINKIDGSGKVSNVAFIGKLHAAGNRGGYLAGVLVRTGKVSLKKLTLTLKSLVTKPKRQVSFIPLKMVLITTRSVKKVSLEIQLLKVLSNWKKLFSLVDCWVPTGP